MKFLLLSLCSMLILSALSRASETSERLVLADHGQSEYKIVLPEKASPSERYAAEELNRFVKEMTGADLPIVSDEEPASAHEILLGENAHLKKAGVRLNVKKLGAEGYALKTAGQRLVIAGSAQRGVLYGVYGLLEDHFGCRWFTPQVSRIPKVASLAVGPLDETKIPALEYREPYIIEAFDGDWSARNRMNGFGSRLEEKHGGKVTYYGFVHTFNDLVPPDKYFDSHPEYFSMVKGKRVKDRTQLCTTNEEVIRIVTEEIRKRMKEHPEATVFSISQNDWYNPCECPKCKALADREGSQEAPVLYMVNRVAAALEKEFPDKLIDTLAYQWSRKPPKTMRPRRNVVVRLCSIECCFSHPLATCDSKENQAFRDDLARWSKISDRLWVWDYVTSFGHYYLPFPNLRVLNENVRYFSQNHVTGIFEEGDYGTLNGDMATLKAYLLAKSLWNPDYPREKAIDEFLEGVYGDAAKPIRRYLDLLQDKVAQDDIHIHIWENPANAPYLTDDLLAEADRLWDEAENAVASRPEVLNRVQAARLSEDYARIERGRMKGASAETQDAARRAAARFFPVAEKNGVTTLNEGGLPLADYKKQASADLGI
jgi:hypothetical protein